MTLQPDQDYPGAGLAMTEMRLQDRVQDAMRSGEWLRTQWIVRVVFGFGDAPIQQIPEWARRVGHVRDVLRRLEARGVIERRDATEHKKQQLFGHPLEFDVPREEWRLAVATP